MRISLLFSNIFVFFVTSLTIVGGCNKLFDQKVIETESSSISASTKDNSSCDVFTGQGKQAGLLEALHKAAKDDYAVEVFIKEVNGQQRVLVLMGETHIKNPQSAAIGREVISRFDYVGCEGFDPSKTWGGRFKERLISPTLSKMGIKRSRHSSGLLG